MKPQTCMQRDMLCWKCLTSSKTTCKCTNPQNTLDLVITKQHSRVRQCRVNESNSDHMNMLIEVNLTKIKFTRKIVKKRNYENSESCQTSIFQDWKSIFEILQKLNISIFEMFEKLGFCILFVCLRIV